MNVQQKILKMLKYLPMSREEIIEAIPEELKNTVNGNVSALLIEGTLTLKNSKLSIAKKKSKYNNLITEVDGIKFDSKLEANRYTELKLLVKAGEITNLERQVPFVVSDAIDWNGKKLREIKYICDFKYHDNTGNKEVVEDAKGILTNLYKLKKSLFLHRYPEYWFREVKK